MEKPEERNLSKVPWASSLKANLPTVQLRALIPCSAAVITHLVNTNHIPMCHTLTSFNKELFREELLHSVGTLKPSSVTPRVVQSRGGL